MEKAIKKEKVMHALAMATSSLLCAVLFVCANTASSVMIHQPEAPAGLEQYCKVR